jgi:hypothetical protein
MSPLRAITVRGRHVVCGTDSEPIPEGRHPRVAAVALCERLFGAGKYTLCELNPWNYRVAALAPCTSAPASPVQKPEVSHP